MANSGVLTFANGQHDIELPPSQGIGLFQRFTDHLNGVDRAWISLWRVPDGKTVDDLADAERQAAEATFLQCAGTAEQLTVEIRVREGDSYSLYVLGHPPDRDTSSLSVQIVLGDRSLTVQPSEVFESVEAASIMHFYCKTGQVDARLTRRIIESSSVS